MSEISLLPKNLDKALEEQNCLLRLYKGNDEKSPQLQAMEEDYLKLLLQNFQARSVTLQF